MRLTEPLVRDNGRLRPASWDEALDVCRVCVVEVEKSRTLAPACSRKAEPGMVVHTDSERVRTSRRMVLEFLTSSVNLELAAPEVRRWIERYGADPGRYGPAAPPHNGSRVAGRLPGPGAA